MNGSYDDLLALPHHVSPTRPRMSRTDRAAQFAPFAALTGYEDAIREEGRLTQRELCLSEDQRAELDRVQQQLLPLLPQRPRVAVTWFCPDEKKSGGAYRTVTGRLKKIDPIARLLLLDSGQKISLEHVSQLEYLPPPAPAAEPF